MVRCVGPAYSLVLLTLELLSGLDYDDGTVPRMIETAGWQREQASIV